MAHEDPTGFHLDLTGLLHSHEEEEEVSLDFQEGGRREGTAPILREVQELVRRHLAKEVDAHTLAEAIAPVRSRFHTAARRLETLATGGSELELVLSRGTAALMHEVVNSLDELAQAAHDGDRLSYRGALRQLEELIGMLEQVYRATQAA